jgi:hypothetical protein
MKYVDCGDFRYYLTKGGQILRQLLNGSKPDPLCQKEPVPSDEIPIIVRRALAGA